MARRKKPLIPGLAEWHAYAGGTSCPTEVRGRFVRGYSLPAAVGNYKINPVCSGSRIRGYSLTFENVMGRAKNSGLHQPIVDKAGTVSNSFHSPSFRSAAQAVTAARAHAALVDQGLAGSLGGRRRARQRRR